MRKFIRVLSLVTVLAFLLVPVTSFAAPAPPLTSMNMWISTESEPYWYTQSQCPNPLVGERLQFHVERVGYGTSIELLVDDEIVNYTYDYWTYIGNPVTGFIDEISIPMSSLTDGTHTFSVLSTSLNFPGTTFRRSITANVSSPNMILSSASTEPVTLTKTKK